MSAPDARHWDVIVVGAGFAGSLVAGQLGARGWRVLVLEAGQGAPDAEQRHLDAVESYRSALAKVPNSPYRAGHWIASPDVTDLAGEAGGGFRSDGYFVQRGPLPYAGGYLRASGGTGLAWTGLAPRMHPEDFRAADFGYGRNWPIG